MVDFYFKRNFHRRFNKSIEYLQQAHEHTNFTFTLKYEKIEHYIHLLPFSRSYCLNPAVSVVVLDKLIICGKVTGRA